MAVILSGGTGGGAIPDVAVTGSMGSLPPTPGFCG